jgi:hypothetical protein
VLSGSAPVPSSFGAKPLGFSSAFFWVGLGFLPDLPLPELVTELGVLPSAASSFCPSGTPQPEIASYPTPAE